MQRNTIKMTARIFSFHADPNHLLSVMQLVVRAKGAELHELEEEAVDLVERHNVVEANVGVSERELVERVSVWGGRVWGWVERVCGVGECGEEECVG